MKNTSKEKKRLATPHAYVILMGIIFLLSLLTYVIPAGSFDRVVSESGTSLVVAGSYHTVESNPTNLLTITQLVMRGLVKNVGTVANVLIVGGAFQIVIDTGAMLAGSQKLAYKFRTRKYFVISLITCLFACMVTFSGAVTAVIPFIPISLILCKSLNCEKVTAVAIVMLGGYIGYTTGLMSPSNVGAAQNIAELPLYSGMGMRVVLLVVLLAATCGYMIWYEHSVQKNPAKSVYYGVEDPEWENASSELEEFTMTKRQAAVLIIMVVSLIIMVWGLLKKGWGTTESSGLLLMMGIICGAVNRDSPNSIARSFDKGVHGVCSTAIVIGIASGVSLILSDAQILDTIVNAIVNVVDFLPGALKAVGMFVSQSLINCLITSGSGQAAATMPIMVPMADLLGVSRQTAVLAFQMGDGFSNAILPWAGATAGMVGLAKVPFPIWFKYIIKLFFIWTVIGMLFMLAAVMIGY